MFIDGVPLYIIDFSLLIVWNKITLNLNCMFIDEINILAWVRRILNATAVCESASLSCSS